MTSVVRKLNFTDRVKIPKSSVRFDVRRDSGGVLAFDARLGLDDIDAPPHARVYVEAWYRTSYMRFDCGTIAQLAIPSDRRLQEIESRNVVRFRVKVVDNSANEHRIVAVADDILAVARSGAEAGRISLLPVEFNDLGDEIWRLQYEITGPVLELNNRIAGIEQTARHDTHFFALVYPAVVREILTRILLIDQQPPAEDDEWWGLWLRWAAEMSDSPLPSETDDYEAWIGEVVAAFCGRHDLVRRMSPAEEPDA